MNYTMLELFEPLCLTDPQKQALIFVREVGAIDNQTYRQMADCDTLKASTDLRALKSLRLFASKGKGKATYYIPGPSLSTEAPQISTQPSDLKEEFNIVDIEVNTKISTQPLELSTQPPVHIPDHVLIQIQELNLKQRVHDSEKITEIIKTLCSIRPMTSNEIAHALGKREDYIRRKYLSQLIETGELLYLFPEMINHPEQAYLTPKLP